MAHFALASSVLSDATTAAYDKLRKRFSNVLEKGLGKEMEDFCWETQGGGGCISGIAMLDRGGHVGGSTTDVGEILCLRGKVE